MNTYLYGYLVILQYILGLVVFPILLYFSAPYGRHFRKGWGPVLQSKGAWFLMELPAVWIILLIYLVYGNKYPGDYSWLFLVLWEIHYVYRTFIYPWLLRGSRKTFPLLIAGCALIFNCLNGVINGYALFVIGPLFSLDYFIQVQSLAGLLLFVGGLAMNIHSDAIIRGLRKDKAYGGKGYYGIPRGGLFHYVSNPHYLGEIIEWVGWAILTNNAAGWAFAWFTFANLMPRAIRNHQWYLRTFSDYPRKRKILVPHIF